MNLINSEGRPNAWILIDSYTDYSRCLDSGALHTWDRQNGHHLHTLAGEDSVMRMVLENLGGGFVGGGVHDRECAHLIGDVLDALGGDFLGLAQGAAHVGDGGLVLF